MGEDILIKIMLFFGGVIFAGVGSYIGFIKSISTMRSELYHIRELMAQYFKQRDDRIDKLEQTTYANRQKIREICNKQHQIELDVTKLKRNHHQ